MCNIYLIFFNIFTLQIMLQFLFIIGLFIIIKDYYSENDCNLYSINCNWVNINCDLECYSAYNLTYDVDVEETKRKIERYKLENHEQIKKNRNKIVGFNICIIRI